MTGRIVPSATYRVQLRAGLTLDAVVADGWLDHAHELGASHLYLSPVLAAVPGSSHGYDVTDPTRVDPELGGDAAFVRLVEAARERGMGLVVDIVPNHMALDPAGNPWWRDVLRNGPESRSAAMFDIDWDHPERRLRGSVLLPVLPDHYGRVLESGGIVPVRTGHAPVVRHGELELPLEPASTSGIVQRAAELLDDDVLALVARALGRTGGLRGDERSSEVDALDELLTERLTTDDAVGPALDAPLSEVAADVDRLDALLDGQHYRLAHWRVATHDLGYRRFFDVTGLIGVRVDRPEVFELTHRCVGRWVDGGLVDGLRVDHPDGLARPGEYFERLAGLSRGRWTVAEKILEDGEALPPWSVDGTTGYDTAESVTRLFLDAHGLERLGELRDELVGHGPTVPELVRSSKLDVLREVLAADVNRATDLFLQVCETQRRLRDETRHELHEVLREAAASLDVYRTYVGDGPATARDRRVLDDLLAEVRDRRPDLDGEVVGLLGRVLRGDPLAGDPDVVGPLASRLRTRFEQLTGPTTAKGKEDTAWYRDVRLVGRNEVGARPEAGPLYAAGLHERLARQAERWPAAMTGLSTHDSKRSEDARARHAALTGHAEDWAALLRSWFHRHDRLVGDHGPSPATRMWIYQTMVAVHPVSVERLRDHVVKALREAKRESSWVHPDIGVEAAATDHVDALFDDAGFLDELAGFVGLLRPDADAVALAQKLVQLMAPGVPDLYWGSEAELLRLVDPDNRTPPDLPRLRAALSAGAEDGGLPARKAHLVRAALRVRARHADLLVRPRAYTPLGPEGAGAGAVLAFARPGAAVVLVGTGPRPRLPDDVTVDLPPGGWVPVVGATGSGPHRGRVRLGDVAGGWPAVLLEAGA